MKPFLILSLGLILLYSPGKCQPVNDPNLNGELHEIAFVSDTQAPMRIEKLFLKANNNVEATKLIFGDIIKRTPQGLFILGDVVSLGKKENKWKQMDDYLAALQQKKISYYGILGNHDVMGNATKGELKFNKRFPGEVRTGYVVVIDSIAVVLLNSNFSTLTTEDKQKQQIFYTEAMVKLDADPAVKFIIVTCHHAPYSNSKLVGSSQPVQQNFVPQYVKSKKAKLFITGHAHAFEWFQVFGKDFVTIGGGGGLHQPLRTGEKSLVNKAFGYSPEFHYLTVSIKGQYLEVKSIRLDPDFLKFSEGFRFSVCCAPPN